MGGGSVAQTRGLDYTSPGSGRTTLRRGTGVVFDGAWGAAAKGYVLEVGQGERGQLVAGIAIRKPGEPGQGYALELRALAEESGEPWVEHQRVPSAA